MTSPGSPAEMPFLDHLEELRQRLLRSGVAFVVGIVIAFVILSQTDLIGFLQRPIRPYLQGQTLVYTHPGAVFGILMDIAFVLGALIASPVIGYQLWLFLAPALYPHERKLAIPLIASMVVLFAAGIALSFFVVLPLTLRFLLGLQAGSLTPMITASEYFGFAVTMSLMFGLVFELPIAILALTVLGVVTPALLVKYRRHAVIGCLVLSAFVTPSADPTSLLALAIPLYVLYEISVLAATVVHRRRLKREKTVAGGEWRVASGAALVVLAFALGAPAVAGAQRAPARPRAAADAAATDTTRRELVKWVEPDSVMRALLERAGFVKTKYQGRRVILDARTRTLQLEGAPGAVARGETIVVGDTIFYNDSTQLVLVRGDTNVLRDPTQGEDVVARGSLRYEIGRGRASVSNISTAVTSGERWLVQGRHGFFVRDTSGATPTMVFVRTGAFTTCDEQNPHYHFKAGQIKLVTRHFIVARPAVLHIGEVPVMWLPFMFQDIRSGRRSGILSPRLGVSEIVRNSPTYRRHIDNIGYYWAFNDYVDGQVWMDWRSKARGTDEDPGWTRWNGEIRYRWLDRFMTGSLSSSRLADQNGNTNTAVHWGHSQEFSQTRRLSADVNYVTDTRVHRRNAFDPRQVLATIASTLAYTQQIGPFNVAAGANRRQYPGRDQVEQTLPTLDITSPVIALARWIEWTPSFRLDNQEAFNLDQAGTVAFRYITRPDGTTDSVRVQGNRRNTVTSFNTPLKIFGFTWTNSFLMNETVDDYPQAITIADPDNPSLKQTRVFPRTFQTSLNWETGITLPTVLQGSWNVSPSVSFRNVDPGPFWVRTHHTGGRYVHQSKRVDYGLSVSPTFFALLPGVGPLTRIRHSIAPRLSYSYSPRAEVDREFLRALNRTPSDYLGGLAQNQVTLQMSHVFEGKVRDDRDSSVVGGGRKIRLASINFSPLTYDFERKRETGKSGFTTTNFSYDVSSDLLPGFSLRVGYSLFQGSPLSDTAVFKPYREDIGASFTVNQQSAIFGAIARVFGGAMKQPSPQIDRVEASPDDAAAQRLATSPVAGSQRRDREFGLPVTQGWTASFTFSSNRQRPPVGGNVIDFDPAEFCRAYETDPLTHSRCLLEQQLRPTAATPFERPIGAAFVRTPPRETLQWNTSFHVTPKWAATWGTTYDFREGEFASQQATLQRELHDWRAIFGFTKAPNGNFAFTFFISLNAQPDLKFNYDKQTYRPITR